MTVSLAKFLRLVLIVTGAFLSVSCSREAGSSSRLSIQLPSDISGLVGANEVLPTGGKLCFSVNVTGTGIGAEAATGCGPALGVHGGFVSSGQSLELAVPKGQSRTVSLYLYFAAEGGSCPDFAAANADRRSLYAQTYQVATSTVDISGETTVVDLVASYPGKANTVLTTMNQNATCQSVNAKTYLLTNGDAVLASTGAALADTPVIPNAISFFQIGSLNSYLTAAAELVSSSATRTVSPIFLSVTRKVDTQKIYGLLADGSVTEIASDGEPIALTGATCPFSSCKVPQWFQSITASRGLGLYGLDHGGNMYTVASDGSALPVPQSIPLHVQQVSFE